MLKTLLFICIFWEDHFVWALRIGPGRNNVEAFW